MNHLFSFLAEKFVSLKKYLSLGSEILFVNLRTAFHHKNKLNIR